MPDLTSILTDMQVFLIVDSWHDPTVPADISIEDARDLLQHAMEQNPEDYDFVDFSRL